MKEKGKKLLWIGSICIAVFLIWTLRIFSTSFGAWERVCKGNASIEYFRPRATSHPAALNAQRSTLLFLYLRQMPLCI